jgi:hypothetical protein
MLKPSRLRCGCASPPAARQSALARRRLALSVGPACRLRLLAGARLACRDEAMRRRFSRRSGHERGLPSDFAMEFRLHASGGAYLCSDCTLRPFSRKSYIANRKFKGVQSISKRFKGSQRFFYAATPHKTKAGRLPSLAIAIHR